jgi:hypothetical protein
LKKEKQKLRSGRFLLSPAGSAQSNSPAATRPRPRSLARVRAAQHRGPSVRPARARAFSLSLSLTRGPHLSSPTSVHSLSPATWPCPRSARPVITASVALPTGLTRSTPHREPHRTTHATTNALEVTPHRPWRHGARGSWCPSDPRWQSLN